MYSYSRINRVGTDSNNNTISKSLDLANFPPHTPTSSLGKYHNSNPIQTKPNHQITRNNTTLTVPESTRNLEQDHGDDQVGEVFGIILSRKFPARHSDSPTLAYEKQSSSLRNAVERSFSMRRSASVAEGYRRMNHCCCHELTEDDHCDSAEESSKKNHVKKTGKLFKACRRLLGL